MKENIKCLTEGDMLRIENISAGIHIQIFDSKGILYRQFISDESSEDIKLSQPGIYLVILQFVTETLVYKVKRK